MGRMMPAGGPTDYKPEYCRKDHRTQGQEGRGRDGGWGSSPMHNRGRLAESSPQVPKVYTQARLLSPGLGGRKRGARRHDRRAGWRQSQPYGIWSRSSPHDSPDWRESKTRLSGADGSGLTINVTRFGGGEGGVISDKFVGWAQTVNGSLHFRTAVGMGKHIRLRPRFVLSRMIRVGALNSGKAARAAIRSNLTRSTSSAPPLRLPDPPARRDACRPLG